MQLRKVLWIAVLVCTAACDPAYYMRVRSPLLPSPSLTCLDSALATSRSVSIISRRRMEPSHHQFSIRFQEPTALPLAASLEFDRGSPPDSAVVVSILYHWIAGSTRLEAGAERAANAQAGAVLDALRLACAPSAPARIECRYEGLRPGGCRADRLTSAEAGERSLRNRDGSAAAFYWMALVT